MTVKKETKKYSETDPLLLPTPRSQTWGKICLTVLAGVITCVIVTIVAIEKHEAFSYFQNHSNPSASSSTDSNNNNNTNNDNYNSNSDEKSNLIIRTCNEETNCWDCTNHISWNGKNSCRWCPLSTSTNVYGSCHAFGSLLNPCHSNENIEKYRICEITEKTHGCHMVTNITNQIESLGIFPNDYQMLRRIAIAESLDGTDARTYRINKYGYYGGIWQVDGGYQGSGFEETKNIKSHHHLKQLYSKIKDKTNIYWPIVEYKDLLKPFYSALAARIYLWLNNKTITNDLETQAIIWKNYYNKQKGGGNVKHFIDSVIQYQCTRK